MAMRRTLAWTLCVAFLASPQLAAAEVPGLDAAAPSVWHYRVSAAGGLMVSSDQQTWLAYDRMGVLGDLQLGYAALPWLDIQIGTALGVFLSEQDNGGLAAPTLGALARLPTESFVPYAFADVGGAFTGALLLPMVRAGIGFEVPLSESFRIGPMLSFNAIIFSNDPGNSTDARFLTLGLAAVYVPVGARPLPHKQVAQPPPPRTITRVVEVRGPSTEILQLVDRAIPGRTDQVELLAPVLFAFDSDALEPVGIAMLHEVSRALAERTDLELIEIRAYSDARGSAEYNHALATRRGQRVYDWLVEHGIDGSRLTLAPIGASEFVEDGADETAHEQNRRVVFRVLRVGVKR
jgi:peptidoglycan-associated lipoprotein